VRTHHFAVLVVVGLCAGLCAAEEPKPAGHEEVMRQMAEAFNATADTLATIKDEAGAKAALPKLIAVNKRNAEVKRAVKALGAPSPEVEKVLAEKCKPEVQAAMKRVETEGQRIAALPDHVAIVRILAEARATAEAEKEADVKKP
jgi:hypothetical protein